MLSSAIRTNNTLQRLVLINDLIDDQGAQTLAIALQDNPNIKEINLSHNRYLAFSGFEFFRIRDIGAESISLAAFSNTCDVVKINLSKNIIEQDYFGSVLET